MTPDRVQQLSHEWRVLATTLRTYGGEMIATAMMRCAEDLEIMTKADDDVVTLAEASRESGYTADYLGRLVKRGDLKNHGRPHAPRVRRSEIPQKAAANKSPEPIGVDLPPALVKSAFASRRRIN
jgi:hypothetical protein